MTAGLAKNSWLSLLQSGTAALRPTTPDPIGICLYFATDTSVLSLWNGSAWLSLGGASGLSSVARNAPVAATGSTVADAAPVLPGFTVVTAADATKGVVLPTAPVAGTMVILKNIDAANAILKVWPDAAATINAIAANADLPVAAKTSVILIADSPTQWYSIPLLPS